MVSWNHPPQGSFMAAPESRITPTPVDVDRVVVPLDGSSFALRAVPVAMGLAAQLGVEVMYLGVSVPEVREQGMDELRDLIEAHGLPAGEVVIQHSRDVAQPIIAHATSGRSLVVMATHGRTGVARAVVGSVTERVLREALTPIVLVGPRHEDGSAGTALPIAQVMACVDQSPLAESVLPVAAAWSQALGADLEVVSVLTEPPQVPIGVPGEMQDVVESSYVHQVARTLESSGFPSSWEVLHGDPARAIVDHATTRPGTMIALTTHGRGGLSRLVLGSVAARVAHASTVPMLVFRPADTDT